MADNQIDVLLNIKENSREAVSRVSSSFKEMSASIANLKSTLQQVAGGVNALANEKQKLNQIATTTTTNIQNGFKGLQGEVNGVFGAVNKLVGGFQLIAAGAALLKGFQFFKSMAEDAARVQALSTVLHQVASNAGITAGAIDKVDKQVQALGITAQDSRESLAQFIQAGLQATEAAKLARAAQDLAVISGETSSATFRGLTQAIGEMSIMMLRWRGIMVTNEEAQERYAAQVGKSVSALADWEKKQALLNLVLERSKSLTGIYEAAMGDASKQASSLARYQTDAAVAIQNGMVPAYQAVITELTKFLIFIRSEADAALNSSNAAETLGNSVRAVAKSFREGLQFAIEHRDIILGVAKAYIALKTAQGVMAIAGMAKNQVQKVGAIFGFGSRDTKEIASTDAAAAANDRAAQAKAREAAQADKLAASLARVNAIHAKEQQSRDLHVPNISPQLVANRAGDAAHLAMGRQIKSTEAAQERYIQAQLATRAASDEAKKANLAVAQTTHATTMLPGAVARSEAKVKATEKAWDNTPILSPQLGAKQQEFELAKAAHAQRVSALATSTAELALLRQTATARTSELAAAKSAEIAAKAALATEAKKLAIIEAEAVARAREAQALMVTTTAQVKAGGQNAVMGAFTNIGAVLTNFMNGGTKIAGIFKGIGTILGGIKAVFGGWPGLILTVVTGWMSFGDGIEKTAKGIDYLNLKVTNAISHFKELFSSAEKANVLRIERAEANKEFENKYKDPVKGKDPKDYLEAARAARVAEQTYKDYEYTEAPKAQKLKASNNKEDLEEAARIEQEIQRRKAESIAAIATMDSKLAQLKKSGKGREAAEITSRLDTEAYYGGKKKQELLDAQDLSTSREQIGSTKSLFNVGSPISMGASAAVAALRKEVEAFKNNLPGIDSGVNRIVFALDHLKQSATSLADVEFIHKEQLAIFDAVNEKVERLSNIVESLSENPNSPTKNPYDKNKDSKKYQAYETELADINKEALMTNTPAAQVALNRKRQEEQRIKDVEVFKSPSKALDNINVSNTKEGTKNALDYFEVLQRSGRFTDTQLEKLNLSEQEKEGLSAPQQKELIDSKKVDLVKEAITKFKNELKDLPGSRKELDEFNHSFESIQKSIEWTTQKIKNFTTALDKIASLKQTQIDMKFESFGFNKSESVGSASIQTDRDVAKAEELYKLSRATSQAKYNQSEKEINTKYGAEIAQNFSAVGKARDAVNITDAETKRKEKQAGFNGISEETLLASKDNLDKQIYEAGGGADISSIVNGMKDDYEISVLTNKENKTEEQKAKLEELKSRKQRAEDIAYVNSTKKKQEYKPSVNEAAGLINEVGSVGLPEQRTTVTKIDDTKEANLRKAVYVYQNLLNQATANDTDATALKQISATSESQYAKDRTEVQRKYGNKGIDTTEQFLQAKIDLENIQNQRKDVPKNDAELAIKEKEAKAKKDELEATLKLQTKNGLQAKVTPEDSNRLESGLRIVTNDKNKVIEAEKASKAKDDAVATTARNSGDNIVAAEKNRLTELSAAKATQYEADLANAQKYYASLKAALDQYYSIYVNKVNSLKNLHKEDIDMVSKMTSIRAGDRMDAETTQVATNKSNISNIQASETYQKLGASGAKFGEDLNAIQTMENQRKEMIRQRGGDEKQVAQALVGVERDSLAQRLEAARSYFASLASQRDEAKAKWKQYADEVTAIEKEMRQSTISTQSTIRDIDRGGMNAKDQYADKKREIEEQRNKAQDYAASGDMDLAKEAANKAKSMSAALANDAGASNPDEARKTAKEELIKSENVLQGVMAKQRDIAKSNAEEQLNTVNAVTAKMNDLAKAITDLTAKSEIILNPKLEEDKLSEIQKQLKGLHSEENTLIEARLQIKDLADIRTQIEKLLEKEFNIKIGVPELNGSKVPEGAAVSDSGAKPSNSSNTEPPKSTEPKGDNKQKSTSTTEKSTGENQTTGKPTEGKPTEKSSGTIEGSTSSNASTEGKPKGLSDAAKDKGWVESSPGLYKNGNDFSNTLGSDGIPIGSNPDKPKPEGRAEGGIIQGIGTGTSDSIPIMASHGEYIVKEAATSHYGTKFLNALNSKSLKFASGGYIGKTIPRFSFGGETTSPAVNVSASHGGAAPGSGLNTKDRLGYSTGVESADTPAGKTYIERIKAARGEKPEKKYVVDEASLNTSKPSAQSIPDGPPRQGTPLTPGSPLTPGTPLSKGSPLRGSSSSSFAVGGVVGESTSLTPGVAPLTPDQMMANNVKAIKSGKEVSAPPAMMRDILFAVGKNPASFKQLNSIDPDYKGAPKLTREFSFASGGLAKFDGGGEVPKKRAFKGIIGNLLELGGLQEKGAGKQQAYEDKYGKKDTSTFSNPNLIDAGITNTGIANNTKPRVDAGERQALGLATGGFVIPRFRYGSYDPVDTTNYHRVMGEYLSDYKEALKDNKEPPEMPVAFKGDPELQQKLSIINAEVGGSKRPLSSDILQTLKNVAKALPVSSTEPKPEPKKDKGTGTKPETKVVEKPVAVPVIHGVDTPASPIKASYKDDNINPETNKSRFNDNRQDADLQNLGDITAKKGGTNTIVKVVDAFGRTSYSDAASLPESYQWKDSKVQALTPGVMKLDEGQKAGTFPEMRVQDIQNGGKDSPDTIQVPIFRKEPNSLQKIQEDRASFNRQHGEAFLKGDQSTQRRIEETSAEYNKPENLDKIQRRYDKQNEELNKQTRTLTKLPEGQRPLDLATSLHTKFNQPQPDPSTVNEGLRSSPGTGKVPVDLNATRHPEPNKDSTIADINLYGRAAGGLLSFSTGGGVLEGLFKMFGIKEPFGDKEKQEKLADLRTATIGIRAATGGKIPALVSHGEFRVTPDAVNHYGSNLISSINDMTFPKFAEGGLLSSAEGTSGISENKGNPQVDKIYQLVDTKGTKHNVSGSEDALQFMVEKLRNQNGVRLS